MPFGSVDGLKQSAAWKTHESLRKMPEFRLRRFVAVFDAIYEKKTKAGAPADEAEATAFAMAFASARRFQATPDGARVEEARHYAVTMAPVQFSEGGEVEDNSFDYLTKNIDTINLAVAGNAFNLDHKHHEPLGVIRQLLLPSQAPAEVRAKMAADAPFVAEFSYFEGTPDDLRKIDTVSAEWLCISREDGRSEVVLPDSFAPTENPASDNTLGVGIIAGATGMQANGASHVTMPDADMEELYDQETDTHEAAILKAEGRNKLPTSAFACPADRSFPIHDLAHARNALGRVSQPHVSKCSAEQIRNRVYAKYPELGPAKKASDGKPTPQIPPSSSSHTAGANSMPETVADPALVELQAKVASMSAALEEGVKAREAEMKARVAAETQLNALKERVAAYDAERLEREAIEAATVLVREGKAASDDVPKWSAEYKTLGREVFARIAALLPANKIGVREARASATLPSDGTLTDAQRNAVAAHARALMMGEKGA